MRKILSMTFLILLTGCVVVQKKDMSAFNTAAPRSILVVPVVNKSLDLDAPSYALATLPIPLAEKGYYVFPVHTTKVVLEREGFYESDRIHKEDAAHLASMFGADSVLFVTINRWDAQYAFIATTVTVEINYRLVSKDNVELWNEDKKLVYSPSNSSGGHPLAVLLVAVINAAIARAAPNYIPLVQQAHAQVFLMGPNALPDGPYNTEVKK
jgi:hypothetical protein